MAVQNDAVSKKNILLTDGITEGISSKNAYPDS